MLLRLIEVEEGNRLRRVGNVMSDIPENKVDGGFESRIRAGLAPRKPLETSCKS